MMKFLKWTTLTLVGLAGLLILLGLALYPVGVKKLARTYPDVQIEMITIPSDRDAIARGAHIATIWACTKCHGEDLGGKLLTHDPLLGTVPAPNLTSGRGGVAQAYTDGDWIRAIRYGIKPDGHASLFMYDYSTMSDPDLGDLIAYLKQLPPVDGEQPVRQYGPLIPLARGFGLLAPAAERIDQEGRRPANPTPEASVEYGKYLSVICAECHSTGLADKVAGWSQEEFIRAIQSGALPDGRKLTPAMPLSTYGQMNEMELTALWLYLQSLQPTAH